MQIASHKPKSADLPLASLVMYIRRQIATGSGLYKQSVSDLAPSELCHTRAVFHDMWMCRGVVQTQIVTVTI